MQIASDSEKEAYYILIGRVFISAQVLLHFPS